MLLCPKCKSEDLYVVDSRNQKGCDYLYRRRECAICGHRFTTVEIDNDTYKDLLKKQTRLQATETVVARCRSDVQNYIRGQVFQELQALQDKK